VRELSTGNRRKVGLVLAFMSRPEVLILDEPTSGLDPVLQEFRDLLGERKAEGASIWLTSHVMAEVERVADRSGRHPHHLGRRHRTGRVQRNPVVVRRGHRPRCRRVPAGCGHRTQGPRSRCRHRPRDRRLRPLHALQHDRQPRTSHVDLTMALVCRRRHAHQGPHVERPPALHGRDRRPPHRPGGPSSTATSRTRDPPNGGHAAVPRRAQLARTERSGTAIRRTARARRSVQASRRSRILLASAKNSMSSPGIASLTLTATAKPSSGQARAISPQNPLWPQQRCSSI